MFDLEKAISDWRRQMFAAGIQTPVPLDELESHLREEIGRQMKSGLSESNAFELSVKRIGQAQSLKAEFEIAERSIMRQITIILAALFGVVFGGAIVLPALGRWQHTGTLDLMPLLAGTFLILAGGTISFYTIRTRHAARGRKLISAGILAAGAFYLVPFIQALFTRNVGWAQWTVCALMAAASILFFGNCYRRNRHLPDEVSE